MVRFPSTLIPGWLYTDPPLSSPSLFPFPQRFPFQIHALLRRHCDIGFTQSDTIPTRSIMCVSLYVLLAGPGGVLEGYGKTAHIAGILR